MPAPEARTLGAAIRRCSLFTLAATALALSACGPQPPPQTGEPDPALLGHNRWCDMSPPSGYCVVDDHR